MFLAFTNELKYNRFACGSTEQDATSALLATITEEREAVFWECREDFEVVVDDSGQIEIKNPGFGDYDQIHTSYTVIEVTESGCRMESGDPITMTGWWEH